MAQLDLAIAIKKGDKKLSDLPPKLRPSIARLMSTLTAEQVAGYKNQQARVAGFGGPQPHTRRARSV